MQLLKQGRAVGMWAATTTHIPTTTFPIQWDIPEMI